MGRGIFEVFAVIWASAAAKALAHSCVPQAAAAKGCREPDWEHKAP